MKTYEYRANNTTITRAEAFEKFFNGESFEVVELVNGKYNGTYENYIPKCAR